jgi:CDP-glucose 4,6-dehydratase
VRAVVVVTSDKCYRDAELLCGEDDPLGGTEPYSASKACAEIAVTAWRSSFLPPGARCGLATARAGNVIGGGDFSPDRLIPDLVRAARAGEVALLRHPGAVRPWQHVLDALSGYLSLAQALVRQPGEFASSWNFGPPEQGCWTAREIADHALRCLGCGSWRGVEIPGGHEAPALRLSAERARQRLGWAPRLPTAEAVRWAVDGYRELLGAGGHKWLQGQIEQYAALGDSSAAHPRPTFTPLEACHA